MRKIQSSAAVVKHSQFFVQIFPHQEIVILLQPQQVGRETCQNQQGVFYHVRVQKPTAVQHVRRSFHCCWLVEEKEEERKRSMFFFIFFFSSKP